MDGGLEEGPGRGGLNGGAWKQILENCPVAGVPPGLRVSLSLCLSWCTAHSPFITRLG